METLILMLDTAAVLAIVVYSYRNEKRPENTPEAGPFRLKPARPIVTPARTTAPARRRPVRKL